MGLTQDDVLEILRLINESEFGELRLEVGDLKLVVRKRGYNPVEPATPTSPVPVAEPVAEEPADTGVEGEQEAEADVLPSSKVNSTQVDSVDVTVEEGLIPIRAPILGIFYRTPKPGASPFVEVGSSVNEDDTVCIIEVMKLFSSIKAGARGRIAKICAENGQMVEYQQTLFLIEPAEGS
ncbi:acetyl-CoA carboxylase biotin carboxyl carrier protein [Chloroflexota bacterium]